MDKEQVRELVIAGITSAQSYQCRPNTYVCIVTHVNGVGHAAVGFAKVQWRDRWDADYGRAMALKKAVAKVVRAILGGVASTAHHERIDSGTIRAIFEEGANG